MQGIPRPSNVIPFWDWYGFWVRTRMRTTQKVLCTLEGLGAGVQVWVEVLGSARFRALCFGFNVQGSGLASSG